MKVSFFETGRYAVSPDLPREWPVPPAAYDPALGAQAFQGMVERARFVGKLGFDWISLSEHHYSPRILTPSPPLSAAFLASQVETIKIALLGPIVPVSNPIRVAEELAMLDTMRPGRFVFGLLRGTTNEYLSYDLNPKEARERTDEGMELILKAWSEPQPFGWQGRYFQYRTVSIWPRPQTQPSPTTYALGVSAEAADFAARHRIGLGVSYGTVALMAQSTGYYRKRCAEYGWEPGPDDIIWRANMILAETDDAADAALARRQANSQAPFPISQGLRNALIEQDRRNVGGQQRPANVGGVLPISFCGGPDRIVEQIRRAREEIGVGVLDLSLADPGTAGTDAMLQSLDLFGRKVLPRIREILTGGSQMSDQQQQMASPGAAFREGFVEADGFRIRTCDAGQGAPLVHLHGAGGLRLNAAHDLLARQRRVIAVEMPGFGQSEENTRTGAMPELAATIVSAADALGLDRFDLMGTSFGGRAALWLAAQHPERVRALVLEAPAAIRPPGGAPVSGTPEQMAARLYAHPERMSPLPAADPEVQAKQQRLVARLRGPDRDAELEAAMRRLDIPTLVLFGTLDRVIPPEMGRHYKELLPNGHLVLVYDAGHAIGAERPEAFVEVVTDFLDRHEAFLISRAETVIHP